MGFDAFGLAGRHTDHRSRPHHNQQTWRMTMLRNDSLSTPWIRCRTAARWLLRPDQRQPRLTAIAAAVGVWLERSRSRRLLAALSDHQLRDVGLSRADAWREGSKPFWRP